MIFPDLKTHDALLISNCILDEVNYFVTNDRTLTKKSKSIKKLTEGKTAIISPTRALQIAKGI